MPATGTTRSGSRNSSLTNAAWSRIALIGQQPSPTASAARMKVASTIEQFDTALKNRSR